MRAAPLSLLLLAALGHAGAQELPQDVLVLTNKKLVEGVILRISEAEETLWLGQETRVKTVRLADVAEMRGPRVALREYPGRLRQSFRGQPEAEECLELARWCKEQGLTRDVDLHYWHALLVDPLNEEAHEALGHQKLQGKWRIKVEGHGLQTLQETEDIHGEFNDPWEFTTAHFEVKAGGSLDEVLNACSALEIVYSAFFETFQDAVGFFEVRQPIQVYLYPNKLAYPNISNTQEGYFDPLTRVVYAYFVDGESPHLQHEATHALLYYTARETGRVTPRIPGWIEEGIATYLDSCLRGAPGAPRFEPGLKNQIHFDRVARADDLDSLTRILNFQTSDFLASSKQDLKYAESYCLTYYLLHTPAEEKRDGFDRFLRSVYERKGSMSHFQNAMRIRGVKELEKEWLAYVRGS